MNGARGVIINVTGGPDMSLMEVNEALTIIQEAAHEDANIIFGAVVDPTLTGRVKITVIATGFDHVKADRSTPASAPMQTPVDMSAYCAQLRAVSEPAAPAMPTRRHDHADRRRRRSTCRWRAEAVAVGQSRRRCRSNGADVPGEFDLNWTSRCRRSCGATRDRPRSAGRG